MKPIYIFIVIINLYKLVSLYFGLRRYSYVNMNLIREKESVQKPTQPPFSQVSGYKSVLFMFARYRLYVGRYPYPTYITHTVSHHSKILPITVGIFIPGREMSQLSFKFVFFTWQLYDASIISYKNSLNRYRYCV